MQRLGTSVVELDLERERPLVAALYAPRQTPDRRSAEEALRKKLGRERIAFLEGPELSGKTATLTATLEGWDGGAPSVVPAERRFTVDLRKQHSAHSRATAEALGSIAGVPGGELRHVLDSISKRGASVVVLDHFDDHYGSADATELLSAVTADWVYGRGAQLAPDAAVQIVVMTAAARGDYYDRNRCVELMDPALQDLSALALKLGCAWTQEDQMCVLADVGGHVGTLAWLALHAPDSARLSDALGPRGILARVLFEHRNWFSTLGEREVVALRALVREGVPFPFSPRRASHGNPLPSDADALFIGCRLVTKGVLRYGAATPIRYPLFERLLHEMF